MREVQSYQNTPDHYLPESALAHISKYTQTYANSIQTPFTFQNHVGTVTHRSNGRAIQHRTAAMEQYLINTNEYHWGRSVFHESAFYNWFLAAFPHLNPLGIELHHARSDMDESIPSGRHYQKGCDFFLTQYKNNAYYPICGIDITVAPFDIVQKKKTRPGFQSSLAMPVITMPFDKFCFGKERQKNITDYLDSHGRNGVLYGYGYVPFYGLKSTEESEWIYTMRDVFLEGVHDCQLSLQSNNEYPITQLYPYMDDVFQLLDVAEYLALQ